MHGQLGNFESPLVMKGDWTFEVNAEAGVVQVHGNVGAPREGRSLLPSPSQNHSAPPPPQSALAIPFP